MKNKALIVIGCLFALMLSAQERPGYVDSKTVLLYRSRKS